MTNKNIKLKNSSGDLVLYPQTKIMNLLNDDETLYNAPKPEIKTTETQKVTIDADGKLWTSAPVVATNDDITKLFSN